jgi:hypothetical protein
MANQHTTLVYSIHTYDSYCGFDDMMIVESFDKAISICKRFNNGNYSGFPYGCGIGHPRQCNPDNKQWTFRPVEVFGTRSVDAITKLYPIARSRDEGDEDYILSSFSTQKSADVYCDYVIPGFLFWEGILNSYPWNRLDKYPIQKLPAHVNEYSIQMLPAHVDDTMICHKKRKMI